jgi:hypothetical protein
VNLAHGLACCLHGRQGLPVDVGRLDRIYLLLEGGDLTQRGLEGAFGDLFASQGLLRSCWRQSHVSFLIGQRVIRKPVRCGIIPVLFVLTFFRAMASCSSIWFCRWRSRFWSMSSCVRRPRMAFLGLSLRFCAAEPPPNQPQIPDDMLSLARDAIIGTASGVCTIGGLGHDAWEVGCRAEESRPRNGVGRFVGDDDSPNVGGAQPG